MRDSDEKIAGPGGCELLGKAIDIESVYLFIPSFDAMLWAVMTEYSPFCIVKE